MLWTCPKNGTQQMAETGVGVDANRKEQDEKTNS
jgi:hypothetical protein